MADYGSSGIWACVPVGPFRHGMLEHSSLSLPKELSGAIDRWIEEYWKVLDAPEQFDQAAFVAEGRRLAVELKQFVGPEISVEYDPEVGEPEDILGE
ncbi:MAG: hypothetical protein IH624_06145 [Phycisphaerae bacterium]|nr:hypothetical protein [Phycisphaerae bacterium]